MIPDWIWLTFIFAFGCCIGSFLNVVIYRLPREKSLITPPSACTACGRNIQFYDNIPLISWLALGARCRYCKTKISPRYFIIELFTATIFVATFILYFRTDLRDTLKPFPDGGWFIYLISITMLSALIAASAIDLELWIIPLSICWFVTAVGLIASTAAPFIIDLTKIREYALFPSATPKTAALAAGALIGLAISLLLLAKGKIKGSYETEDDSPNTTDTTDSPQNLNPEQNPEEQEQPQLNHRLEMCREILFLLPIIACSIAAYLLCEKTGISSHWSTFTQHPALAGLFGSLWAYFIGCAVVWITRILGTLAFGKEAMGLGDVHLMGAAGAVIGPVLVVVAFFIAPFFGLTWAAVQMFFKKNRLIPYGPFLSLGIFTVMILHDRILAYLSSAIGGY